jgi:transposase
MYIQSKIFLLLMLLIISCGKEEQEIVIPEIVKPIKQEKKIEGSVLKIEHLKEFVPSEYLMQNKIIIFVNKNKEERKFILTSKLFENMDAVRKDEKFKGEIYIFNLDSEDKYIQIKLHLQVSHISDKYSPTEMLTVMIGNDYRTPSLPIGYNVEKKKLLKLLFEPPQPTLNLNGKQFANIFSEENNYTEFSALHYTASNGVVGFKDYKNDLWVFDRFE